MTCKVQQAIHVHAAERRIYKTFKHYHTAYSNPVFHVYTVINYSVQFLGTEIHAVLKYMLQLSLPSF